MPNIRVFMKHLKPKDLFFFPDRRTMYIFRKKNSSFYYYDPAVKKEPTYKIKASEARNKEVYVFLYDDEVRTRFAPQIKRMRKK